jgi:hypothetical protein
MIARLALLGSVAVGVAAGQAGRYYLQNVATHPINRIAELLPHNWKPLATAVQA